MSFSTPLKSGKAKKIAMATFMPLKSQRTLVDITEDPTQKKCATVFSTPLKSGSTVIDLAEDPTQEINIIERPRWERHGDIGQALGHGAVHDAEELHRACLLYTSPSPRDRG